MFQIGEKVVLSGYKSGIDGDYKYHRCPELTAWESRPQVLIISYVDSVTPINFRITVCDAHGHSARVHNSEIRYVGFDEKLYEPWAVPVSGWFLVKDIDGSMFMCSVEQDADGDYKYLADDGGDGYFPADIVQSMELIMTVGDNGVAEQVTPVVVDK